MPGMVCCPTCEHRFESTLESEQRCPECQTVFNRPTVGITATPPAPLSQELQSGAPARRRGDYANEDDFDHVNINIRLKGGYKPSSTLALATRILLALGIMVAGLTLLSNYMQYELAKRAIAGRNAPQQEIESNDARQGILGIATLLLYLATAVVFVIWFHRLYANLEPLGALKLNHATGWAAGCWFVPFLNLVRPVQIAQEIWRKSDPEAGPHIARETGSSALIGAWWALWLISSIIGNVSAQLTWSVKTPNDLQSASSLSMVSDGATILAGILALAVVTQLDGRQAARAEAVGASGDYTPGVQ